MTRQNFNQDDESIVAQPGTGEQAPPTESTQENLLSGLDNQGDQGSDVTKGTKITEGAGATPTPRKRTRQTAGSGGQTAGRRKRSGERVTRSRSSTPDGIIKLSLRQNTEGIETQQSAVPEATLSELEAQGFTEDEAYHLIHVSDRIANSRETREAEAIIRRLRFNRWLFEQGKLSEFSA